MSVFGRFRDAGEIEQAVIGRLKQWMPWILQEVATQQATRLADLGLSGTLPAVKAVIAVSQLARHPEDQLPCLAVVCPGTLGEPNTDAEGYYHATYSVVVGAIVATGEEDDTRLLAQLYGAAVRGCLLQRRSLGGEVEVSDWTGESFDDLEVDNRRSYLAGVNSFAVEAAEMVSWKKGPTGPWPPDGPPGPPDPEVPAPQPYSADEVVIEVEKEIP